MDKKMKVVLDQLSILSQSMESLFVIQEEISDLCGDILIVVNDDKLNDEEILETLNNFFESDENKFSSREEVIEYFENLNI